MLAPLLSAAPATGATPVGDASQGLNERAERQVAVDDGTSTPITTHIAPIGDRQLLAVADFLVPRLELLLEGEAERLELRMERIGRQRARFSILNAEGLLAERELEATGEGFDSLTLWLAMKSAWARSKEVAPSIARSVQVVAPPQPRTLSRESEGRAVTIGALSLLQPDRLSAFGASLGFGRGSGRVEIAGDVAYALAPVDDTLTVHHLIAQAHLSYALLDGFSLEGTSRLAALVASSEENDSSTVDVGFGASAHVWFGAQPELWLRTTVLGHPVTQRYLFDGGERESSRVTLSITAGVGL